MESNFKNIFVPKILIQYYFRPFTVLANYQTEKFIKISNYASTVLKKN